MFNPLNSEQERELRALIHKHELQEVEERIVASAQNAVVLDTIPWVESDHGISRLGGLPDVPEGWQWPEGLMFLGQINLEEIAPHDHNHQLPPHGLLLFFNNQYGWDQPGLPGRVEFIEDTDGTREVHRCPAPRDFLPISLCGSGDGREVHKSRGIVARSSISLPTTYSRAWEAICSPDEEFENDMDEAYSGLLNELGGRKHQLLGHHAFMDGNADEEAWAAQWGVSSRLCGQPVSEEDKERTLQTLEKNIRQYSENQDTNPESAQRMVTYCTAQRDAFLQYLSHKEEADAQLSEWVLLFQMDSDDDLGTMWSDAGFAYFMIRKTDLAARNFDRVFASLWTS